MIVGEKDRFGIEFELDETKIADPVLAEWMFGRVRWWCGGEAVGLYEPDTTVRDIAIAVRDFQRYAGKRQDAALMSAAARDVVAVVTAALFGDPDRTDEQIAADDLRYRRFWINPEVDVFDPWTILLVEDETRARMIWCRADHADIHQCELAAGEFDSVGERFLEALDDIENATAESE